MSMRWGKEGCCPLSNRNEVGGTVLALTLALPKTSRGSCWPQFSEAASYDWLLVATGHLESLRWGDAVCSLPSGNHSLIRFRTRLNLKIQWLLCYSFMTPGARIRFPKILWGIGLCLANVKRNCCKDAAFHRVVCCDLGSSSPLECVQMFCFF